MSALWTIVVSLVVGIVLAVAGVVATDAVFQHSQTPSNQPAYNYGS